MKVVPMNKTNIIQFGVVQLFLKLWKVSKSMRKRLKWLLKGRVITIRKFNENMLSINGWVKVGREPIRIKDTKDLKKGVSNYLVRKQKHIDALRELNGELRCDLNLFSAIKPCIFTYVGCIWIDDCFNFSGDNDYLNLTFQKIKELRFIKTTYSNIKSILSKIDSVEDLTICNTKLKKLDLSTLKCKKIGFDIIKFTEPVRLPSTLKSLHTDCCRNLNYLLANRVTKLKISLDIDKEVAWFRRIKGMKVLYMRDALTKYLKDLPSTLRSVDDFSCCNIDGEQILAIKRKLPYLIEDSFGTLMKMLKFLNLRKIIMLYGTFKGRLVARPRQIEVREEYWKEMKNHPELFEKVDRVGVWTKNYPLTQIPSNIKILWLQEVNTKSLVLNRFKVKC